MLIFILILSVLLLILITIPLLSGRYLARRFCLPKSYSLEDSVNWGLKDGSLEEDPRTQFPWEDFFITTEDGLELRCHKYIHNPEKIMLIIHGHKSNWLGMAKYFVPLIKKGWSIVAFDHRYFGESQGEICTGGFREKEDSNQLIRLVREQYPQSTLGIMGESMGGAITLQVLGLNPPVDLAISVCPYTDLPELFHYHLVNVGLRGPILKMAYNWSKRFFLKLTGIALNEISALETMKNNQVPLLLIHGDSDDYVPSDMSIKLHKKYPEKTQLLIVPGGTHAHSFLINPEVFWAGLWQFLEQ